MKNDKRAEFEAWLETCPHNWPDSADAARDAIQAGWQAATAAEREACKQACNLEHLHEPSTESDSAYDTAINHCIDAIRARGVTSDEQLDRELRDRLPKGTEFDPC